MADRLTPELKKAYQTEIQTINDEFDPIFRSTLEKYEQKPPVTKGEDLGGPYNELVRKYNARVRKIQEKYRSMK